VPLSSIDPLETIDALSLVAFKTTICSASPSTAMLALPFINKLVSDEARLTNDLKTLMTWKPHLEILTKQRAALLGQRWAARA
jgi:hypothetical protein